MRPSRRNPQIHFQLSRPGSQSSSSVHFHYESSTDSSSFEATRTRVTPSRQGSISISPNANRPSRPLREESLPTPTCREDLVSICEHSAEEEDVGFPHEAQLEDNSEDEPNSEFTFHCQRPEITAQKSRFSRPNNSEQTSSEEGCGGEGSKALDDTFSYEVSKLGKEHQFQFCETPKPPKEIKASKEDRHKDKQRPRRLQETHENRMTFVKYEPTETEEGRRYPFRASRVVPRLKYWEGERTDPINQGYWKRISD